ncbi:MAG: RrF2 family transcriptional regulator [Planctomycetota bacterium]
MIRISRKCEYALKAVFELAVRSNDHPVKIHHIAAAQNIPPRFLEVILNELRHAGLVQSRRGNVGGYMLARRAEQLTVRQIIEHIDGPIAANTQDAERSNGADYFYGDNAFGKLWENVAKVVAGICENTSIAELVETEKRSRANTVVDYTI